MSIQERYNAQLAENRVIPTFLCGHCSSTIPKARIFRNDGDNRHDMACHTIGLCSADDCGAVNCLDDAMRKLEQLEKEQQAAG